MRPHNFVSRFLCGLQREKVCAMRSLLLLVGNHFFLTCVKETVYLCDLMGGSCLLSVSYRHNFALEMLYM